MTTPETKPDAPVDSGWTVRQVITQYPDAAAIFAEFGVHTCCGSDVRVGDAARRDGADPDALLAALVRALPDL